jgi:cob(I)alamin adenosyltransferase
VSRKRDEPVRLTRIYTRGGDSGETSLGDGSRVSKTDPRIEAIGAVDELNSVVGWTLVGEAASSQLVAVQNDLFDVGADLSVPPDEGDRRLRLAQPAIDRLEAECDAANADLAPLKSFVLPGGCELAARLYLARAVARRAERSVLRLEGINPLIGVYLNRLSDLLFILARAANAGGTETLWKPGGSTEVD